MKKYVSTLFENKTKIYIKKITKVTKSNYIQNKV